MILKICPNFNSIKLSNFWTWKLEEKVVLLADYQRFINSIFYPLHDFLPVSVDQAWFWGSGEEKATARPTINQNYETKNF